MLKRWCVMGLAAGICLAADKRPPAGQTANEQASIEATLLPDKEAVRQELGSDLGGYFTVVRVSLTPKSGKVAVARDDFTLRSDRDGQRSGTFAPSQIAGRGALVISSGGGRGVMAENPGPVWGGYPGTGAPRRLGGDNARLGNSGDSTSQATLETGSKEKEDPVLGALKSKILPEGDAAGPVAGLLYFMLEGKHKPKDLELLYHGPAGKLSIRFR